MARVTGRRDFLTFVKNGIPHLNPLISVPPISRDITRKERRSRMSSDIRLVSGRHGDLREGSDLAARWPQSPKFGLINEVTCPRNISLSSVSARASCRAFPSLFLLACLSFNATVASLVLRGKIYGADPSRRLIRSRVQNLSVCRLHMSAFHIRSRFVKTGLTRAEISTRNNSFIIADTIPQLLAKIKELLYTDAAASNIIFANVINELFL